MTEVRLPPPRNSHQLVSSRQREVNELWNWIDLVRRVHRDAIALDNLARAQWVSAQASLEGYQRAISSFLDTETIGHN